LGGAKNEAGEDFHKELKGDYSASKHGSNIKKYRAVFKRFAAITEGLELIGDFS